MIILIFWIVSILILWFESDAFVEYSKLFGFKFNSFKEAKNNKFDLTFPQYLVNKYPSFLTKLISCPICLSAWLIGVISLFFEINILYFAPIYILSLFIYFMLLKIMR